MRRPILTLGLAIVLTLACGIARADYLDHVGGHGPLSCSGGPMKDYNQVEAWSTTTCERWTGDVGPNGPATLLFPSAGMISFAKSPNGTSAYACLAIHNGNYGWCTDSRLIPSGTGVVFPSTPIYIQINAAPPCPTNQATAFTVLYWAPGSYGDWTPMDGYGLPTAVIADGHVAPGLPHGNPLKLSDADVCVANLANYPNLPTHSGLVAAVYTLP